MYEVISADDHVQEPPDLWTSRLSKTKFGDRIPHLERDTDGAEHWVVDGRVLLDGHVALTGALMPDVTQEPRQWSEVPPAAYVPADRLKAMDEVGVRYSVLFPTVAGPAGEAFGSIADPELELACVQAYNDWLIEEWAGASDRFVPQCIVPVTPAAAADEIRRAVAKGHRGVVYPAVPMELKALPHIAEPEFDPLWATCQELDVPLCLHAGASRSLQYSFPEGLPPRRAEALDAVTKPVSMVYVLNTFLFARILTRYPKLKLVLAESGLSWAMLDLEWSDHQFEHDELPSEGYEFTPLQLFHRQCYLNTWYDPVAPFAHYLGADRILWSTNLPRATSTWPKTQEIIERSFQGASDEVRKQVLWDNAASLYKV